VTSDLPVPSTGATTKRLVLVAGVGRSGTSLFTSILSLAGFHVPQPEVQADATNPKGFGEPQWAVDFHGRQLRSRRVSIWDSRPAAFDLTAEAAADPATVAELQRWLEVQFVGREAVVVKDPRLGWFLPLWEKAADGIGVDVSVASLLRHPAEAVSSALKWYGDWQTPASRTVSWINIMLEVERVTRGRPRVFVRYDDLLSDWSAQMSRTAAALELPSLASLDPAVVTAIDTLVDPTLHRQKVTLSDVGVPSALEVMTEELWQELVGLSRPGGDDAASSVRLDEARERYRSFYADVEAIAQSSLHALRPAAAKAARKPSDRPGVKAAADRSTHGGGADSAIRFVERYFPRSVLRKVSPVWRARLVRMANRAGRLVTRQ
jgi:hypothetical protein